LREVFFGQTIEPERAGLVTEIFGHRILSLAFCRFRTAPSVVETEAPVIYLGRAFPIRRDKRRGPAARGRPARSAYPKRCRPLPPQSRPLEAFEHRYLARTLYSPLAKENRGDGYRAATQAHAFLRNVELTAVWVPDPGHEAMRDLARARLDAVRAAWNRSATNHGLIRSLCAVAWAPASPAL
jgi:hypothetical protein